MNLLPTLLSVAAFVSVAAFSPARERSLVVQLEETTGLKPVSIEIPQLSRGLLAAGVTSGDVQARIELAPSGEVSDYYVVSGTDASLALAWEKAISEWKFEPTGETDPDLIQVVHLDLSLFANGFVVAEKNWSPSRHKGYDRFAYGPSAVSELDEPLALVERVIPAFDETWLPIGLEEVVTVSYIIGREGTVHVPFVEGDPDPRLAALAIEAVKQWKFSAPIVDGRETFVCGSQTFHFARAK